MTAVEYVVLGLVQGIVEWLPISSEGVLVLIQTWLFEGGGVTNLVGTAVFLHLGTVLAATVYFWEDLIDMLLFLSNPDTNNSIKPVFTFLFISTLFTGVVGYPLLNGLHVIEARYAFTGPVITAAIGILLLATAAFLYLGAAVDGRTVEETTVLDSIVTGLAQGFAILPGVSRSGITVSTLLLREVDDTAALKLSFLMSIPAVIGGNVLFQLDGFTFTPGMVWGVAAAFVTGLASIHLLLDVADRIDFTWFVAVFGAAMLLAAAL